MTAEKIFKSLQNMVNETEKMRTFQKEYFRYKDQKSLNKAKIQEQKIDEMIAQFKNFKFKTHGTNKE